MLSHKHARTTHTQNSTGYAVWDNNLNLKICNRKQHDRFRFIIPIDFDIFTAFFFMFCQINSIFSFLYAYYTLPCSITTQFMRTRRRKSDEKKPTAVTAHTHTQKIFYIILAYWPCRKQMWQSSTSYHNVPMVCERLWWYRSQINIRTLTYVAKRCPLTYACAQ